jgi:hypothetical protein
MRPVPDGALPFVCLVFMPTRSKVNLGLICAALVCLSYASLTLTPASLNSNVKDTLAAVGVGVTASVSPNQYNTLAEQLDAKEAELNQREAALNQQGSAVPITNGLNAIAQDRLGFYSLCVSVLLLILVAINFYYDVRRRGMTREAI